MVSGEFEREKRDVSGSCLVKVQLHCYGWCQGNGMSKMYRSFLQKSIRSSLREKMTRNYHIWGSVDTKLPTLLILSENY